MRLIPVILAMLVLLLMNFGSIGQDYGCTDPQALNYDQGASVNDGSCLYSPTYHEPDPFMVLPPQVMETSGIIYFDDGLWTHNDSGGEAAIYKIDMITGNVIQTIEIHDGTNTDWEDIDQDEDYIYIGDFGNNSGNRKDLHVRIIAKDDIPAIGDAVVDAETISFYFEDQTSFNASRNNHNYDCEAMICVGDSLYLFSKNWVNQKTRLYRIPKLPGNFTAVLVDSFNVEGLITGAAYNPIRQEVTLTGYRDFNPFIWLLFDYHGRRFFSGNKRRIDFTGMLGSQVEGVSYHNEDHILLSSERTKLFAQKVFKVGTGSWTYPHSFVADDAISRGLEIQFNPSLADDQVHFEVYSDHELDLDIEIYDYLGRLFEVGFYVYNRVEDVYHITMDISNLPTGFYVLKVGEDNRYGIGKLIKN